MNSPRLLLITDGYDQETPERVKAAISALPPGSAAVQLRAKQLDGRALFFAVQQLRPLAPFLIVNDRADVALAAGADGVHLPAHGLPVESARRLGRFMVGRSTHSLEEARRAEREGADYLVFGPVFSTPNKGAPVGVAALREVAAGARIPVFALGGVSADNAAACVAAGARLACIGAVLGRPVAEVAAAARALWGAA